jgi:5S rRNA maturation endonuclease (ribonuclease M5)
MKDNRWCLICQPKNRTIYWHQDEKTGKIWGWCNKCDKGYPLQRYCQMTGLSMEEFLSNSFHLEESRPNEVNALAWPSSFIPLSDPRAAKGVEYIKSRGLTLDGDMYYDMDEEGIVFPYYFGKNFCGAQVRFITPRKTEENDDWKITTLSGTRLGLLFYGWNQEHLMANVKGIVVTEGAFNALAIQQALNTAYGSISNNPWRAIACSGSGATEHHKEALKELKDKGLKVVIAPDTDEAGMNMATKIKESESATHTAFTGDTDKDWNDLLKDIGDKELAKFFLSCIIKV